MLNLKGLKKSLFTKGKESTEITNIPTANGSKENLPTKSFKYYSSTKEISCHIFWTTIIDGVLSRLIYEGELTNEEKESEDVKVQLAAAWQDILIEHAETISDDCVFSGQQVLDAEKKTTLINWAASTILYLQKNYHEGLNVELKKKFRSSGVQLDISNPFQYHRDLERCTSVAKSWQFELSKQQDVINERYGDGKSKSELTYKSFAKTLVPMAKFMGGKVLNAHKLMVYDYDLIYSQMIEQAESEKK